MVFSSAQPLAWHRSRSARLAVAKGKAPAQGEAGCGKGLKESRMLTFGTSHADSVHESQVDMRHLAHQAGCLKKCLRGEESVMKVAGLSEHLESGLKPFSPLSQHPFPSPGGGSPGRCLCGWDPGL